MIRRAGIGDAELLAKIGTNSFREAYGPHSDPTDLETHIRDYFAPDAVFKEFESGDSLYLIATVDGEAGGLAKCRKAACPVDGGDANAVELQQLYVLAAMQRHGLGQQLVDGVIDYARQNEAAGLWLSAWEFADWAIRFYERVGFAGIAKVEFKLGATTFTDILMWRSLE